MNKTALIESLMSTFVEEVAEHVRSFNHDLLALEGGQGDATTLLQSLPEREYLCGLSEIVKAGVIGDPELFQFIEEHIEAIRQREAAVLTTLIERSIAVKVQVVQEDPTERGVRAILNFGHTLGHALEAATGFSDRLVHGEGVAIGMALAFQLSVRLGLCPGQDAERFVRHLKAAGLPSAIADIAGARPGAGELIRHMAHDKKVTDGKLTFILVHGLGRAFVTRDVPLEAVKSVLTEG